MLLSQTVWPNARVALKNVGTNAEVSTVSSDLGAYNFAAVPYGEYEITVTLAGFDPVTKHLTIKSDEPVAPSQSRVVAGFRK